MAKSKPAPVDPIEAALASLDAGAFDDLAGGILASFDNPTTQPATQKVTSWDELEREMARMPHLSEDRKLELRGLVRTYEDCRQVDRAADTLKHLPGPDESHHIIVSGKFALWDVVPAAIRIAGPLDSLHIATLGLSNSNAAELCNYLDAGKIRRASLLCSHYFKGTSRPIFEYVAHELSQRPNARFCCLRSHAKILLMGFADGRRLVAEASANLRSCQNIEQITLSGHPELYEFHRTWIDELFSKAQPDEEPRAHANHSAGTTSSRRRSARQN
jgi:hypothetical protein